MASKRFGASAIVSSVSRLLHAFGRWLVRLADRFGRRTPMPRTVVEVALLAGLFAYFFRRLSDYPTNQSTFAYIIVMASCVFYGAFRLSRAPVSFQGFARECVGLVAIVGPTLVAQMWVRSLSNESPYHLADVLAIIAFADVAVFVVGRFIVVLLPWWLRFNQQKLRWQLVQAHIVVVLVIISGPMALLFIAIRADQSMGIAEPGASTAENIVLRLAYTIIPTLALSIVLFGIALAVVIPPSIALSYVVARRMTRRLENLATATTAIREGDRSARVAVQGRDEVAQLQTNFNAMADVLEDSIAETAAERDKIARLLELRRELVASVSHELRTPLTIIRGHLDSALTGGGAIEPNLRRDIEVMHGEALRLQRLIDDLFALSRAEVGALTFHPRSFDVTATLKRCAEAASPAAWRTNRIEIVVEAAASLPPIMVDPERLEQILFNLINNAVRHSPPGGLVHLSAARDGDIVRIDVADTGEGIAPDELSLVWDRFYRGKNAKDARGSGIGLSVVRELTEAMGGAVCVVSTLGEGTQFTLRFPIAAGVASPANSAAETTRLPQAATSALPATSQP